ncbi:SAM-dependent methyltransferase [Microbacterium natoriense]|uniref:SAM-dependent methyltransferase n=1 Tax=Microbacterium natoriense TaxID=284570 RepID=A0AAW8F2B4_9MICO|nr:class I SAM-dependent methyltransferase [Microbacterium natoriense]MDQ0649049.1 SAM-dependent methyltransferase [Microbacterium natoriense]
MISSDSSIAAAYGGRAAEYIEIAGALEQMDERDVAAVVRWRDETTGPLLDAGCGPGQWTALLAEDGRDARGIDLTESFVAFARSTYPGLPFEVGSFRRIPVPTASLGGILSWYSLIHTPPAEVHDVLSEFARALAPGGGLLIGFFEGEPREPFAHAVAPAYYWNQETLGELLVDAGFVVTGGERRAREPGEISARPHASVTAVIPRSAG